MKRVLKIIGILISFIILLVGAFFLFTALWVRRTWTKLSASSIIFQLQNSLEGTGNGMVKTFILTAALPAVLLTAVCIVLYFLLKKKRSLTVIYAAVGAGLFVLAISLVWKRIGLGDYLKYRNKKSSFIEDNYVSPEGVGISFPEKKRNVIYIYLESMEVDYADKEHEGEMDVSLIPNLTGLEAVGEDFSGNNDSGRLNGAYSMYGTDWTMGAIFAESSGLPLIIPIQKNSMFTQSKFFPTVTTFGDILKENGYKNVILFGHDAEFAGGNLYFSSHGDYEIQDYKYARKSGRIPEDYMVFWGYEDEKLFQFAKEELSELSASDQPFNLTLLTVDTHFEDGYYCRQCRDEFDDQYKNVIACSDRQVSEFVKWCMEQDFYENTTIIISGDHPTMDRDFSYDLKDPENRRVYISIINPAEGLASPDTHREYTTFDLFPTSLAAIGVRIEGNRLGLGTNLFSERKTLLENYGQSEFNTQLKMKSDFMTKLADIDEENADSFLDVIDESLRKLDADIELEETETKGKYKVSVYLLSDRPSCMNYINTPYITVYDDTYSCSYLLEYNNEYSITEGKTCYEAYFELPLTQDIEPDFINDIYMSGSYDGGDIFLPDESDKNGSEERDSDWKGQISIELTIHTHNNTYFTNWSKDFTIE